MLKLSLRLPPRKANSTRWRFAAALALTLTLLGPGQAFAQTQATPSFWDPRRIVEKPDLSKPRVLRFITEDDYPPFDFIAPDGSLMGFNVELARAICEELKAQCTVQTRRWDTILGAIETGVGDAAIASLAITSRNLARVDFTAPYFKTPARFVVRLGSNLADATPESLAGMTVGVQARTAHEAFLRDLFPLVHVQAFETAPALLSAIRRGEVDAGFGDGVAMALWLNGTDAAGCCAFKGGPYLQTAYFGEGAGIAVAKGNTALRLELDYALRRVAERGVFAELYLKYFPIGFF